MNELLLREIIDRILYRRQKTPWNVLGKQLSDDCKKAVQPYVGGPIDIESETRIAIVAELWDLYGPKKAYLEGDTL